MTVLYLQNTFSWIMAKFWLVVIGLGVAMELFRENPVVYETKEGKGDFFSIFGVKISG